MPQLLQNTFIAAPPKELVLPDGFKFTHGETIAPFTLAYETFGELNADKSNAILVCHALSASAHAAGKYPEGRTRSRGGGTDWSATAKESISTGISSSA